VYTREAYTWFIPQGVHQGGIYLVYTSGCTIGCTYPGLYFRVYHRVLYPGLYRGVYQECYIPGFIPRGVPGVLYPGLYLRVYLRGYTPRLIPQGVPPWVSFLANTSGCTSVGIFHGLYLRVYLRGYPPCYSRFTVGVPQPCYSRFTVGCVPQPLFFPFHCWVCTSASFSLPVSLLGVHLSLPSPLPVSLLSYSSCSVIPVSLLGLYSRRPCAVVLSVAGFPYYSFLFPVSLLDVILPFHCWTLLTPVSLLVERPSLAA